MRKLSFAVATFAAAMCLGAHPSHAYYGNAPWCAVVAIDSGTTIEKCTFADLESCRQEVIAGNRGYCNTNPYFAGQFAASPKPRLVRKRVRH
jgi:Protein of unknown function (DUF3551)